MTLPDGIQTTAQLQAHYAAVRERLIGKPPAPKRALQWYRPMLGPPAPKLIYGREDTWQSYVNRVTIRTGFTYFQMCSLSKRDDICWARFEACYLLRQNIDNARGEPLSWSRIGRIFGKDHTTVIHGAYRWAERNGLEKPR